MKVWLARFTLPDLTDKRIPCCMRNYENYCLINLLYGVVLWAGGSFWVV